MFLAVLAAWQSSPKILLTISCPSQRWYGAQSQRSWSVATTLQQCSAADGASFWLGRGVVAEIHSSWRFRSWRLRRLYQGIWCRLVVCFRANSETSGHSWRLETFGDHGPRKIGRTYGWSLRGGQDHLLSRLHCKFFLGADMWIFGVLAKSPRHQIHQIHQVSLKFEKNSPKKSSDNSIHNFWVAQELDELLQGTCAGDRLLAELPDTEAKLGLAQQFW